MTPSHSESTSDKNKNKLHLIPTDLHHDEDDVHKLREELALVRKQRTQIQAARDACQRQQAVLLDELRHAELELQEMTYDYLSTLQQRQYDAQFLKISQQWNVTNDAFYIWHEQGSSFATINGARLGAVGPSMPPALLEKKPLPSDHPSQQQQQQVSAQHQQQQQQDHQSQRSYWLWYPSSLSSSQPSPASSGTPSTAGAVQSDEATSSHNKQQPPQKNIVHHQPQSVPWAEVNAALGHACLLLKVLQEKGNLTLTHELFPMASTSHVGIVTATTSTATAASMTRYPLYWQEESSSSSGGIMSSFFGSAFQRGHVNHKEQFHIALQAFVQNMAEASLQQPDKTMIMPHDMRLCRQPSSSLSATNATATVEHHNNNPRAPLQGEWTIGGIPMIYHPDKPLEFTKACKYLLTNLKWLVAYSVKHVDL